MILRTEPSKNWIICLWRFWSWTTFRAFCAYACESAQVCEGPPGEGWRPQSTCTDRNANRSKRGATAL